MDKFPATSLIIIVIIIVGFFAWQFNLHNRYSELQTCTGDRFANNTCSFGAGCDTSAGAIPSAQLNIPTNKDKALNAIQQMKKDKKETIGRCTTWLDFIISPDNTVTEETEL